MASEKQATDIHRCPKSSRCDYCGDCLAEPAMVQAHANKHKMIDATPISKGIYPADKGRVRILWREVVNVVRDSPLYSHVFLISVTAPNPQGFESVDKSSQINLNRKEGVERL